MCPHDLNISLCTNNPDIIVLKALIQTTMCHHFNLLRMAVFRTKNSTVEYVANRECFINCHRSAD